MPDTKQESSFIFPRTLHSGTSNQTDPRVADRGTLLYPKFIYLNVIFMKTKYTKELSNRDLGLIFSLLKYSGLVVHNYYSSILYVQPSNIVREV
uniref:Uncharacterized protein n=1 Tax=Megaselia scalaris TaxID=36166 RepID=T1GJR0_MEGSC